MSGKLTFNRLLHNNKAMIAFSVVAAIAIWFTVAYSVSDTKSIVNVPVDISLSGTYADSVGLKVFDISSQQVTVIVSGSKAVTSQLTKDAILVTGTYSGIKDAGTYSISLHAANSNTSANFDIKSVEPSTIDIMCDYKASVNIPITTDITGVSVVSTSGVQLGTPVVEAAGITNNTVTVSGPKSEVSQIAKIVAKVKNAKAIADVTDFAGKLVAYDAAGNELSISHCTFDGLTDKMGKATSDVTVTVPVLEHKTVTFNYNLANLPAAYTGISGFCTVSPASIELIGTPDLIKSYAASIGNLGTFDFNHINLNTMQQKVMLNIPVGLTVMDGTSQVSVTFAAPDLTAKKVDLSLASSLGNVQIINLHDGREAGVALQKITGITLIGSAKSIAAINASNLSAVVDMANSADTGTLEKKATIHVSGYDDVWVYYGAAATNGYNLYVKIQ